MITDFTDGRKNDGEKKGSLGEEKAKSRLVSARLRVLSCGLTQSPSSSYLCNLWNL